MSDFLGVNLEFKDFDRLLRQEELVEEPVSIAPSQQGMQMIPSIFTADPKGEFRLNTSSITMYAETDDNIKDKYLEATTGIKVPSKKIVLG